VGLFSSLRSAPKKVSLARRLAIRRIEMLGALSSDRKLELMVEFTAASFVTITRTPEFALLTIIETYADLIRAGASTPNALQKVDEFRVKFLGGTAAPDELLVGLEWYLMVRLGVEFPDAPGTSNEWLALVATEGRRLFGLEVPMYIDAWLPP